MCRFVSVLILSTFSHIAFGQTPRVQQAFPGAEGFGAGATGGRGGQVLFVDNVNDGGPGSLREALNATGPRTVIFRTGGNYRDPYSLGDHKS